MCSSMENVASEIHHKINYDCTTFDDCTEIQCTTRHSILQSMNFIINSCEKSLDVELHMEGDEITTVHAEDNTTETLDSLGVDLIIDLWHFDYSMDVEVYTMS